MSEVTWQASIVADNFQSSRGLFRAINFPQVSVFVPHMDVGSAAEYARVVNIVHIVRIFHIVGAIIVLYDHAITLDREIDHIWNYSLTAGSVIYMLIRFIGDALAILNIIAFLGPISKTQALFVFFLLSIRPINRASA
ncbi:hypothetical protein JVU11DRAFT_10267 [Chiua virens]|nr:hypothetical protein JVU11DRAFT_10267 [Chiua virens]